MHCSSGIVMLPLRRMDLFAKAIELKVHVLHPVGRGRIAGWLFSCRSHPLQGTSWRPRVCSIGSGNRTASCRHAGAWRQSVASQENPTVKCRPRYRVRYPHHRRRAWRRNAGPAFRTDARRSPLLFADYERPMETAIGTADRGPEPPSIGARSNLSIWAALTAIPMPKRRQTARG